MTVKDLLKSLKKPTLITISDHLDVGTVSSLNLNVNAKYFNREIKSLMLVKNKNHVAYTLNI